MPLLQTGLSGSVCADFTDWRIDLPRPASHGRGIEHKKKEPRMGQAAFHALHGGSVFLGFRKNRSGATEIVYDDGVARRMVWRVTQALADEARLSEALARAVNQTRVLPALYAELKKRAIMVEAVIR